MENYESQSAPPPRHDPARLTRHGGPPAPPSGDPDFPIVRRGGYDRAAVHAYVARAQRLVMEMDAAATNPGEAVRRALDRVGEETAGILRHAQETAASMTSRSETESRERLEGAERRAREREEEAEQEAERLKAQAEIDVRRLDADNDRLWEERQRLIDETRKLSASLRRVAEEADQLFPPEPLGARVDVGIEADEPAGRRPGAGHGDRRATRPPSPRRTTPSAATRTPSPAPGARRTASTAGGP